MGQTQPPAHPAQAPSSAGGDLQHPSDTVHDLFSATRPGLLAFPSVVDGLAGKSRCNQARR